ncbi:MAG TPA: hypothetical protein VFE92_16130 [Dermatophilaceae bacterium]|nr:hypothetical protein [Dermatophilaceae bacterium]
MPQAFMVAMEAESDGPSKIPDPSRQAYWVPERFAPNSRTVDPAPLTRWLPDTLTLKATAVREGVWLAAGPRVAVGVALGDADGDGVRVATWFIPRSSGVDEALRGMGPT